MHITTISLLAVISSVSAIQVMKKESTIGLECVRGWQQPMLTRALIGQPSRPVSCHPDGPKCPKGKNEQCQFSFRNFRYVCCEDRQNEDPPECPRYHDTLLTLCDTRENACSRGFRCMGSRHDESIRLCCRPNPDLKYPEPETSCTFKSELRKKFPLLAFKDKKLVPRFMPVAPKTVAQIRFGNHSVLTGELFSVDELAILEGEPTIELIQSDKDRLYTIAIFDISTPNPVYVRWMAVNVPVSDGILLVNSKSRIVEPYDAPHEQDKPIGMHVLILAVYEQKATWNPKNLLNFHPINLNVAKWIAESDETIPIQPIAGNFYAYMALTE